MKLAFNVFVKKLVIFTLLLGLISFVIGAFMPKQFVTPAMPFLLIFFFAITAFTFYLALKAFTQKTSRFANFFMISVFAKLLLYVSIIIIYAFINTSDIISFIITFFIFYIFFTSFETIAIMRAQKSNR